MSHLLYNIDLPPGRPSPPIVAGREADLWLEGCKEGLSGVHNRLESRVAVVARGKEC
jgi:hypothetical protein